MKIIIKITLSLLLLIILLLLYLYYSSQTLLSNFIEEELEKVEFENLKLELNRPSFSGILIKKVSFTRSINNIVIKANLSNLKVAYSLPSLFNFRVNSVTIEQADLLATIQKNNTKSSTQNDSFKLPKLNFAPLNNITIINYNFNAINFLETEVKFQGKLDLKLKEKNNLLKLTTTQNTENKFFDKILANLNLHEVDNETILNGEFDIEGFKLSFLPETPSFQIKNTIAVTSELATLKGSIESNSLEDIKAKTTAQYFISKKNGFLNIDFEDLDLNKNYLSLTEYVQTKSIKNNLQNLKLNSGTLLSKVALDVENNKIEKVIASIAVKKAIGIFEEISFSNLNLAEHKISLYPKIYSIAPSNIYIKNIDYGFSLENTNCQFEIYKTNYEVPVFGCNDFSTNIFGGQIIGNTLKYNPELTSNLFNIKLKSIKLEKLLLLHPQESLIGTGSFDGYLPIRISNKNSLTISKGEIKSKSKGGILQYKPESNPFLSGNQQLKIIGNALDNFHYNQLNTVLDYNTAGDMLLNAEIKGKNPDMNKEQEIHVNLKLEENIPALLRSLRLSSKVGTNIEKGLKRK